LAAAEGTLELYIVFKITYPTDECEHPLLKLLVFLSMSTPDFGIADVVVPPDLFFSFRYNRTVRIAITNLQPQYRKSFPFWRMLPKRIEELT
jgi:hypothetical protein